MAKIHRKDGPKVFQKGLCLCQTFQRVINNKNKNDIKYSSSIEGWEVGS
jgi:hypothetical protein